MRVFVSFQETVHKLDLDVQETIGDIKNTLREKFGLNLKNQRNETDQYVSLVYQGSNLQDSWVYSDLGIPPGSALVCSVEKQIEPTLSVHCVNFDETIEYKQDFDVWDTSVGTLRGMIQDSTGIHVSAFRLFSKSGLELFDCHQLKVYGVDKGDTVAMEIWRDVAEVVHTARENDITDTLGSLASFQDAPHLMRYQLQLGLFTAAHYDYHQLATQLMKSGAKPDQPVGQHPSRDWCRASAHVDHVKTPAHEAAQHGRLKCLQHFLMFNYAVLICKDANGLTPCNVARRFKQTECFKLLVAEQFRIPSVHPELSVHVYSRVRKWCDRARMRARLHKDKTALLLLTNAEVAQKCAVVGQKVEVDGFNDSESGSRKIKSAPSSLNANHERMTAEPQSHSATSCDKSFTQQTNVSGENVYTKCRSNSRIPSKNAENDHLSRAKTEPNLLSHGNPTRVSSLKKELQRSWTQSGVSSQEKRKASKSHSSLHNTSYTNEKLSHHRAERQNSSMQQRNRELHRRSTVGVFPVSVNTTPGKRSTLSSSFVASRVSHPNRTTSRGSTRGKHEASFDGEARPPLTSRGTSRYIWKPFDDVNMENVDNHRASMDKSCKTRTSATDDPYYPDESTDTPIDSRESLAQSRGKSIGSTVGKASEKRISQGDLPVWSRDRVGDNRRDVTSGMNGQSSVTRETYNSQKMPTPGSSFEASHHDDNPVKRRSAQSRNLVYQGSVESNADMCLRVACETFRKKSWLGQLQMALVVNTNMCKRR